MSKDARKISKLKDTAMSAVQKGKYKKALEAYQELEKLQPNEGGWGLKQGDMYKRLGQKAQAIAAYTRACEDYSRDGFLLKAVAVCKLILELDPDHRETQTRLAELHAARTGIHPPAAPPPGMRPPPPRAAPPPPPEPEPTPPAPPALDAADQIEPPPPTRRTLPPDAPLEAVNLAELVPGSRESEEIPRDAVARAMEIPIDELDALMEELQVEDDDLANVAVVEEVTEAPPVMERPASAAARSALPNIPLFSALDEGRLRTLIERVDLLTLEPGDTLFREGDPGNALFVVVEGEVAVVTGGQEVARLGEGAFFGEIALLTNQPRSATITAVRETGLLAIDRATVSEIVEGSPEALKILLRFLRDRLVDTLVETNPLFSPYSGGERQALAKKFRFVEVEVGVKLIEQGEQTPGLYILLAGKVRVSRNARAVAELGPGDVFGENSLLTQEEALATIETRSKSYLLFLPRAQFTELIMTHPHVLEYTNSLAEKRRAKVEEMDKAIAAFREGKLRTV